MELLQYKYHNAYVIQASSTDMGMSWRKFKVRAKRLPPERYCNYVMASGGRLSVYNADSKKMDDVAEADWHETRPVFFEDHKYNLTLTFFDAVEEPRIIHPNKEVEAMFNTVQTASGEYVVSSSLDFLNQPGHFALEFAYKNTANEHIQHKIEFDVLSPKLDTKHDLDIIIQQIRAEYGDLVFRYLTLTFQQFEMGREANNELIWLSVFKQIVDSYVQAVRFIIHQPHNKMRQYKEYRRAERIKGWTPMLVHQDFSEKGFPTVEIYTDRIDVSNPGQPIISVERFIDEYNSRNSSLADLMRRLGICEELGSGLDKAVAAIELFQLPPLRFTVQEARTTVTLFAYRKYADLDRQERIYAYYQHACLKYVTNDKMTNLTLRERLGIDKQNYPMASRIIKDTLIAGKIKEEKMENQSRNNKGYVPFWA